MEYCVLVVWHRDVPLLMPPTIICRSWHPSEDPDLAGDDAELKLEINLHERGSRMCEAYSRLVRDGEFGHMAESRLLAIPQRDFEEALRLLQEHDLPEYEERVYNAVARAAAEPRRPSFL